MTSFSLRLVLTACVGVAVLKVSAAEAPQQQQQPLPPGERPPKPPPPPPQIRFAPLPTAPRPTPAPYQYRSVYAQPFYASPPLTQIIYTYDPARAQVAYANAQAPAGVGYNAASFQRPAAATRNQPQPSVRPPSARSRAVNRSNQPPTTTRNVAGNPQK